VKIWLGRIPAKFESQSWKGHTSISDRVYSLGSMDCDVHEAYITRS